MNTLSLVLLPAVKIHHERQRAYEVLAVLRPKVFARNDRIWLAYFCDVLAHHAYNYKNIAQKSMKGIDVTDDMKEMEKIEQQMKKRWPNRM